jgi:hypothetical protein
MMKTRLLRKESGRTVAPNAVHRAALNRVEMMQHEMSLPSFVFERTSCHELEQVETFHDHKWWPSIRRSVVVG